MTCVLLCFFFSSRRRHTRYWRDWSSDVCSSDLGLHGFRRQAERHICGAVRFDRSEEHTSELQSRQYLVCRLLLEKKQPTHVAPTGVRHALTAPGEQLTTRHL